jgi:hypothetical protein
VRPGCGRLHRSGRARRSNHPVAAFRAVRGGLQCFRRLTRRRLARTRVSASHAGAAVQVGFAPACGESSIAAWIDPAAAAGMMSPVMVAMVVVPAVPTVMAPVPPVMPAPVVPTPMMPVAAMPMPTPADELGAGCDLLADGGRGGDDGRSPGGFAEAENLAEPKSETRDQQQATHVHSEIPVNHGRSTRSGGPRSPPRGSVGRAVRSGWAG